MIERLTDPGKQQLNDTERRWFELEDAKDKPARAAIALRELRSVLLEQRTALMTSLYDLLWTGSQVSVRLIMTLPINVILPPVNEDEVCTRMLVKSTRSHSRLLSESPDARCHHGCQRLVTCQRRPSPTAGRCDATAQRS